MEWHNTAFAQSGPLSVHKLFTSCIRRCVVPATEWCGRLSVICRVTYFQFLIQSAFLRYISSQAAPALRRIIGFDTQYGTADVAKNLSRYLSCAEGMPTVQGKDFELILTVKMETRHPVEDPFGSEFPAICNHCGVMTAWSRKTWKFCEKFLRVFFGKIIPYGKIFKIVFRNVFTVSPIDVVVLKFRDIYLTGNRRNRALFTWQTKNKISAASQTVTTARIAPKIYQIYVLTVLQISSKSVIVRRSYSRTR